MGGNALFRNVATTALLLLGVANFNITAYICIAWARSEGTLKVGRTELVEDLSSITINFKVLSHMPKM